MKKVLSERKSYFCGIGLMVWERFRDFVYKMMNFEAVYLRSCCKMVYKVMVIVLVCF